MHVFVTKCIPCYELFMDKSRRSSQNRPNLPVHERIDSTGFLQKNSLSWAQRLELELIYSEVDYYTWFYQKKNRNSKKQLFLPWIFINNEIVIDLFLPYELQIWLKIRVDLFRNIPRKMKENGILQIRFPLSTIMICYFPMCACPNIYLNLIISIYLFAKWWEGMNDLVYVLICFSSNNIFFVCS